MKFVVAKIDFFDNNLAQELIEADSEEEAILKVEPALREMFDEDEEITVEALKGYAFDCDCMVNAFPLRE